MPLYSYDCQHCGRTEEVLEASPREKGIKCPTCEQRMQWRFPIPVLRTDTSFQAGAGWGDDRGGNGFYSKQLGMRVTSMADVRRECERRGWECEEAGVKGREPEDDPHTKPYQVAEDIVQEEIESIVKREHGGRRPPRKKLQELKEATAERLAGAL